MKTLKQTDDGAEHAYDISLDSSGDLAFSDGKAAYGSIIEDVVRTLEGEMQLDVDYGVPYQRTIWRSISELAIWEIYVRRLVTDLEFVRDIESLYTEVDGTHLSYTMTVNTDAGAVEVSGSI